MKKAILYIRVSTEEQAHRGYSQRSQEEVLRKHCFQNGVEIQKIIYEDYSAKTFDRPEWQKLISITEKQVKKPDLLLFTKWDRFSRNTSEAYQMIAYLHSLGIDPQAIEQPIDLSVPENKMMLAIYLTTPEIDNDRRGLNTFFGLRKARKEGRWTSKAPVGYKNLSRPDGRKYIDFDVLQAPLMAWVFREIALNKSSLQHVWKQAYERGLTCKKNHFLNIIRSPFYCGEILVRTYKDEEEHYVNGQHPPLISKDLFNQVQRIIATKRRTEQKKIFNKELTPLRGYVKCSKCKRKLTSSASRARNGNYYYYHCSSACGFRISADNLHNFFYAKLKQYQLSNYCLSLLRKLIEQYCQDNYSRCTRQRDEYATEILRWKTRIESQKKLLNTNIITQLQYNKIQSDAQGQINSLRTKIRGMTPMNTTITSLTSLVNVVIIKAQRLHIFFKESNLEYKHRFITAFTPNRFTVEDLQSKKQICCSLFQTKKSNGMVQPWNKSNSSNGIIRHNERFDQRKKLVQKGNTSDLEKVGILADLGIARFLAEKPCTKISVSKLKPQRVKDINYNILANKIFKYRE